LTVPGGAPLPDAAAYLAWLLGDTVEPTIHPTAELLHIHGLLSLQQARLTGSPAFEAHLASMRLEGAAWQLGALLLEGGIDFLPLKGWDVAFRLYDDPALRPMSDLDLWVGGEGDFARGLTLLLDRGYSRVSDGEYDVSLVDPTGQALIELHHGLDSRYRARLTWDELWGRSRPWLWNGLALRRMDPTDLWCYLAFHFGKHVGLQRRLMWLLDLHLLQRQSPVDPHAVVERAGRWRIQHALRAAAWELKRLGLDHPPLDLPSLPAPFRGAPWDVGLFGRWRQVAYHLWIADRLWDRLRYGWDQAT